MSAGRFLARSLLGPALCVLLLQGFSGPARADDYSPGRAGVIVVAMVGMDMDETDTDSGASAEEKRQIPAGRPKDPDYKPVEAAADDSKMALMVAVLFGLPVAIWLIGRAFKKSKKTAK